MRPTNFRALAGPIFALVLSPGLGFGQDKPPKPKSPPDEFKAMLSAVEDAYKAPREVDKDVLDELRKQYKNATPEREAKIFREIRRLYVTTPDLEERILVEIRRSYEQPTAEQEERIFRAIRRGGQLPLGTVSIHAQADEAAKLFRKLDRNADGALDADEMTDNLAEQRARWDRNGDGAISFQEYGAYYQVHLKSVAERVASGELPLKLPKSAVMEPTPTRREETRPLDGGGKPAPDLPAWFTQFDQDADGQIGLYEWRRNGGAVKDFQAMDRNDDGFLEASELRQFLAEQARARSGDSSSR